MHRLDGKTRHLIYLFLPGDVVWINCRIKIWLFFVDFLNDHNEKLTNIFPLKVQYILIIMTYMIKTPIEIQDDILEFWYLPMLVNITNELHNSLASAKCLPKFDLSKTFDDINNIIDYKPLLNLHKVNENTLRTHEGK